MHGVIDGCVQITGPIKLKSISCCRFVASAIWEKLWSSQLFPCIFRDEVIWCTSVNLHREFLVVEENWNFHSNLIVAGH